MFKCTGCGYIYERETPPMVCPNCGAAKEKFEKLADEAWDLVRKARFTNDLLVHLLAILEECEAIAGDGIEDALDPECVTVFTKVKEMSSQLIQSIKAELASHVSQGKWG